jgi:uncharacterized protein
LDLNLERPGDHHFIRSLNDQGIRVGETWYPQSLIISANHLISDWSVQTMKDLVEEDLAKKSLEPILNLAPEILLIGTGSKQVFLQPQLTVFFYQKGIGVEVMTTDAACRTFNVLVSEGRNVVAALMPQ